jgi:hypothetical protein
MELSREALRQACLVLAASPDAPHLFASLAAVLPVAQSHPVRLAGDAEVLNPLLDLALRDRPAYDRALALVNSRRQAKGQTALGAGSAPDGAFDKVEYQREFMAQKRQRLVRAADIENTLRPERDRLIGRTRQDFMGRTAAQWKSELDGLIERAREAPSGRLSRSHMDGIRTQFWASIDRRLDEQEAASRQRLR